MTLFWNEFSDSQARYNLRYALWNIRKLLKDEQTGVDPIISSRTSCQINPDLIFSTDIAEFQKLTDHIDSVDRIQQLETAVKKYNGPLMDGFTLRNLSDWEDWYSELRDNLQNQFLNAVVELGDHFLSEQNAELAIPFYNNALSTLSDYEPAHKGIIQAYADQGKVSMALRHFMKYSDIMRREYNAPPHPDIVKLTNALKTWKTEKIDDQATNNNISVDNTVDSRNDKPMVSVSKPEFHADEDAASFASNFVGRESELAEFDLIMKELNKGRGQVLIISGELGIGKTRLFNEMLRKVSQSVVLGIGEAEEIHSTRPLDEIIQMLKHIKRDPNLPSDLKLSLNQLLAEGSQSTSPKEIGSGSFPLGIRNWIAELASQKPVILALDDMHWASQSALTIFAALSQEVKRLPILLVGIFRTYELQSDDVISSSLISLARSGRLKRLELEKLDQDDTIKLLTSTSQNLADRIELHDANKIYQYCGGIPLYAVEMGEFIQDEQVDLFDRPMIEGKPDFTTGMEESIVPPLMIKITKLRLSKLPENQMNIIKICSILIGQFSLEFIGALTDLDSEALEDILIDLEQRNFLYHSEEGDQVFFGFRHQMIKLAIAQTMTTFERRRQFKAVVHALDVSSEVISTDAQAYYLYQSGDHIASIQPLLTSANSWLKLKENQTGMQYSRTAFKIAIGKIESDAEQMLPHIRKHCNSLVDHGFVKEAIEDYNLVLIKLESPLLSEYRSDIIEAREDLRETLRQKPKKAFDKPPRLAVVSTKRALANTKFEQNDFAGALAILDEAEQILEELPDTPFTLRESGMSHQVRAKIKFGEQSYTEASQLFSNALELLLLHGTKQEIAETWRLLGEVQIRLDKPEYAYQAMQQCRELAQSSINLEEIIYCNQTMAVLLLEMSDREDEAEKLLQEAIEISGKLPQSDIRFAELQLDLGEVFLQNNKKKEAAEILNKVEDLLNSINDQSVHFKYRRLVSRLT